MATATAPEAGLHRPSNAERTADAVERVRVRALAVPTWLWTSIGMLALIALSAYMRSRYLGGQLWMDEAITTGIATHSLSSIPHIMRFDGNPPLYYMLLHIWISWLGDSASATHAMSLLFGLLTIPVGGWGAWRMFGRRAGVMAALLFAFNAWLTAYAQETRMYELVALEGAIATVAYVLAFIHGRRPFLILFGAALVAMLYTHSWGTFFFFGSLLALIPALLAAEDRKRFLIDVILTYGIAGACYLPWAPTLLFQAAHTAAPWDKPPRFGAPIQISRNLLGGDRITAVLVLSAAIGLGPLCTRRYRRTRETTVLWTLICLPIAVLALAWIGSQVTPAWSPRYFAPILASLLFLLAWGCSRARALGVIALVLALWYLHDPAAFAPPRKSDMQTVANEIAPMLHPGDIVAVGQPEQTPLSWFYLPGGLTFTNTANHGRILADPRYEDWVNALANIKSTQPTAAVDRIVGSMRPGQQLLFVRPLTVGANNWTAPWTLWVRRRSAQWGAVLQQDVARGILVPEAYAPLVYHDVATIADSAVLYRRTRTSTTGS
jgi:mannosyltransferase